MAGLGMTPEQVVELKHSLAGMAELLWSYFHELQGQGFSNPEALEIVIRWQQTILGMKQGDDE